MGITQDHTGRISAQDTLALLIRNGFQDVVYALSQNEVYHRNGRINKSAVARVLGIKNVSAGLRLNAFREAVKEQGWGA